jgi:glycosyltransferase involved in cell wall biosynthesis
LTVLPAYVPIRIAHDGVLRPLSAGWRALRARAARLGLRSADREPPGRRAGALRREDGSAAHDQAVAVERSPTRVAFRNESADMPMVIFNWRPSSYFGWGVYGLNLMLHWARRSDLTLCCARAINNDHLVLNPIERMVIDPVLRRSRDVRARLSEVSGRAEVSCLVLNALGNNLGGSAQLSLGGTPTIGIVFFENSLFDATVHERARRYPLIVAGSTWNRDVLRELGVDHVETVIQGVDTTHFHPAPRAGLLENRFVVFSGGKLERRKGQDLVVRAFRAFAQRHPEALLVTAWTSPWPQLARSLEHNASISPIPFRSDGQIDIVAWLRANGIPERQVLDLGRVPNANMPRLLRECDVALFPNRAEGGTNLVAMECMACGVPTILSANTGHLDLIRAGNSYPLEAQTPIADPQCRGWGESSIDEIVETLETAYRNRSEAQQRGRRGAETLADLDWGRQLDKLAELIRPHLS